MKLLAQSLVVMGTLLSATGGWAACTNGQFGSKQSNSGGGWTVYPGTRNCQGSGLIVMSGDEAEKQIDTASYDGEQPLDSQNAVATDEDMNIMPAPRDHEDI